MRIQAPAPGRPNWSARVLIGSNPWRAAAGSQLRPSVSTTAHTRNSTPATSKEATGGGEEPGLRMAQF